MYERNEKVLKGFRDHEEYLENRIHTGIEAYRKGEMTVTVTDGEGKPVPGARVEVHQQQHDFKFGANLFMLGELESQEKNAAYEEAFKKLFNLATLPFYWDGLEPEQGKPRFAADSPKVYRRPAPDLCLDFCEKNGITPKAHCLVYDSFVAPWARTDLPAMRQLYEKRLAQLAQRYAHRIPGWEVINETITNFREDSTAFMYADDYVEWSFDRAAAHFPANELILNEYGMFEDFPTTRAPYFMLIDRLLREGKRVDAIGMQFHSFWPKEQEAEKARKIYNPVHLAEIMDLYTKFNRPLQITEITIPAYSWNPEDEEVQAELLEKLYSLWFAQQGMEAAIYWNLVDGYAAFAPLGDMTAGENYYHGGLLRHDFSKKPAYDTLYRLIHETWQTNETRETDLSGRASLRGFYGQYAVTVSTPDTQRTFSFHLSQADPRNTLQVTL